jgi:cytochrome d ubiquinol oxidase subunit II
VSGADLVYFAMGLGLIAYVLTAGADFGGGVWDLLARGPRAHAQRAAIEHAIAPIWEANHVWLIVVVVLMFTAFPIAFSAISVALHIPITCALVGIMLRGAAFTFRAYGIQPTEVRERWGRVFAWSSVATPVFLGATLAALATGAIAVRGGQVESGFFAGWLLPFYWLVGLFTLVLFAMLAAVYLTGETDGELREDFRRRALIAETVAAILAALVLWRASADASLLFEALLSSGWTLPVQGATFLAAVATIVALWTRRFRLARLSVAAQVALVVLGFGFAMDRHLILPDLPIAAAGARPEVIPPLLGALGIGSAILLPSLGYLFRVFKRANR